MGLVESMQSSGRWLFRYRGQLPLVLFLLALPAVYVTDYDAMSAMTTRILNYSAAVISVLGFLVRFYTVGTTPQGTSGRNTKEQVAEELNSSGIYSVVRHPLYLGCTDGTQEFHFDAGIADRKSTRLNSSHRT